MTAQDPFDGKDQSAPCAVAVYGLQGVRRTRRIITAGRWRKRRDERPVEMDEALEQGRCKRAHGLGRLSGGDHRPKQTGTLHKRPHLGAPDSGRVFPWINDNNGIETTGDTGFSQAPAFGHHTPGPVPGHRVAVLPDRHEDGPGCTGTGGKIVQAHALD